MKPMEEPTIPTGTVISGTLRLQDLAPAFGALVNRLTPEPERVETARWVEEVVGSIVSDPDHEWAPDMLEVLVDQINSLLPNYLVFGSHEGDPADFGVWEAVTE